MEIFSAVDIPPTVDQNAVNDYLRAEWNARHWEMQDGYPGMTIAAHRQKKAR
jgi:hypothetical protein